MTKAVAIEIAREYLQAVRAAGVNVRCSYLFGSYARNRQHEWSDIDVALVGDDFVGLAALDKDRFRHLHLLPRFLEIETHTFPTRRLEEGDPFLREIRKTGIELTEQPTGTQASSRLTRSAAS